MLHFGLIIFRSIFSRGTSGISSCGMFCPRQASSEAPGRGKVLGKFGSDSPPFYARYWGVLYLLAA